MSDRRQPWDFYEATNAARSATGSQKDAEQARRDAATEYAEAERIYRKALAAEILKGHGEGVAWTVCQDLARGNKHVADLRYERDVKKGVLDAAEQRAWRHTADRKDVTEFIQWSRMTAPLGEQVAH